MCVRVCGVEGRGKSLSSQFFFVCEKDDREESITKSLGGMTRPKDEMGSQIVSSESDIYHPILVYLSRNNNSQAQARRFPALTAESLIFRRASLLSRNEFESGTFTIALHATSSFTYVSVIYGANFPFNSGMQGRSRLSLVCRLPIESTQCLGLWRSHVEVLVRNSVMFHVCCL